jgi:hypothetical protein
MSSISDGGSKERFILARNNLDSRKFSHGLLILAETMSASEDRHEENTDEVGGPAKSSIG